MTHYFEPRAENTVPTIKDLQKNLNKIRVTRDLLRGAFLLNKILPAPLYMDIEESLGSCYQSREHYNPNPFDATQVDSHGVCFECLAIVAELLYSSKDGPAGEEETRVGRKMVLPFPNTEKCAVCLYLVVVKGYRPWRSGSSKLSPDDKCRITRLWIPDRLYIWQPSDYTLPENKTNLMGFWVSTSNEAFGSVSEEFDAPHFELAIDEPWESLVERWDDYPKSLRPRRAVHIQGDNYDKCTETIRGWLKHCRGRHTSCRGSDTLGSDQQPGRFINVGDLSVPMSSARVHLEKSDGRVERYLALSYCWGGYVPKQTTTRNLKTYHESLPFDELPETFRDAIELTRSLGFQYLWIDALCIIQDSREDWEAESKKMGRIFRRASIVLASSHAENPTSGLFPRGKLPDHVELPVLVKGATPSTFKPFQRRSVRKLVV